MSIRDETLHKIVHGLIHINHKHRKIMVRRLERTGVFESQHRLLMNVARNNEYSQKQLADTMKVSTAAIAVSLKKLEKGGYVERLMNADDNRYNQIMITEKGQKVVEESKKIFKNVDEAMFAGFDDWELNGLSSYLERINANLDVASDLE